MKRVEFADDELGDVGEKDKRKRVGGPLRRCVGAFFCFLRIAPGERRREERRLGGLRLRRWEERRRGGAFGNVRRVERALERRDFSWGALGRRGFAFCAGCRGGFSENVFFLSCVAKLLQSVARLVTIERKGRRSASSVALCDRFCFYFSDLIEFIDENDFKERPR